MQLYVEESNKYEKGIILASFINTVSQDPEN